MNKGLDYRNIGRNEKGELTFFTSKPKSSIKPKRAIGKGLSVSEKTFAWKWYQANSKRLNVTDAFTLALKKFSGRTDTKSSDLKVLKSYFSYGNNEASFNAYVNLQKFSTLVK
jgi:hypothetical protein